MTTIVDVDWSVMTQTRRDAVAFFYLQRGDILEIYTLTNHLMLRCKVNRKQKGEFWVARNLFNAVRVSEVSGAQEDAMQSAIAKMGSDIEEIKLALRDMKKAGVADGSGAN